MNKEELKKIAESINKFSRDYNCRIELQETDITTCGYIYNKYHYTVIAKKEDRIEC